MRIDLRPLSARTAFLAPIALIAGALGFFGVKLYVAQRLSSSSDPALWRKAIEMEPGNADYWSRAGLDNRWAVNSADTPQSLADLETAASVNPRSADLWMELADAYRASGDPARAQVSFEKAQAVYPISAEVAWRYGNFLLYGGNSIKAYEEIRRAVAATPSLTGQAVAECWRFDPNIASILAILPPNTEAYLDAMDYFLTERLPDPALTVWQRAGDAHVSFAEAETIPLVNLLIDEGRIVEAQHVWQQLVSASAPPQGSYARGSLVFNGGFDREIANGGFDWREAPIEGALLDFDPKVVYAGTRSFRIRFDGAANVDFRNLFQFVPAQPGAHYHFSAYVRSEQLSTDTGLLFEIIDPRHPAQVQTSTSQLLGTNPWTLLQSDIVAGPDTNLLEVIARRIPSLKFDNKVGGTVWIGEVSLKPIDANSVAGAG